MSKSPSVVESFLTVYRTEDPKADPQTLMFHWKQFVEQCQDTIASFELFMDDVDGCPERAANFFSKIHGLDVDVDMVPTFLYHELLSRKINAKKIRAFLGTNKVGRSIEKKYIRQKNQRKQKKLDAMAFAHAFIKGTKEEIPTLKKMTMAFEGWTEDDPLPNPRPFCSLGAYAPFLGLSRDGYPVKGITADLTKMGAILLDLESVLVNELKARAVECMSTSYSGLSYDVVQSITTKHYNTRPLPGSQSKDSDTEVNGVEDGEGLRKSGAATLSSHSDERKTESNALYSRRLDDGSTDTDKSDTDVPKVVSSDSQSEQSETEASGVDDGSTDTEENNTEEPRDPPQRVQGHKSRKRQGNRKRDVNDPRKSPPRKKKKTNKKRKQSGGKAQVLHTAEAELLQSYLCEDGSIDWNKVLPKYSTGNHSDRYVVSDEITPSLLMYCISIAYPAVIAFLNDLGIPVDMLFHAGREARELLDLAQISDLGQEEQRIHATCTPVLSSAGKSDVRACLVKGYPFLVVAAMVADIANAYSIEFKEAYMDVLDKIAFVRDNRGSREAVYRCSYRHESIAESLDNDAPRNPHFLIGQRSIVGVPVEKKEDALNPIHTELMLLFNDATREVMRQVLGMENPVGYIPWRSHYLEVAKLVREIQSCPESDQLQKLLDQLRNFRREESCKQGILEEFRQRKQPQVVVAAEEGKQIASGAADQIGFASLASPDITNQEADKDVSVPSTKITEELDGHIVDQQTAAIRGSSTGFRRLVAPELPRAIWEEVEKDFARTFDDCLPYYSNLQLTKVGNGNGGTFSFHKDSSFILISPSHKKPYILRDGRRLPTGAEMAVATTCFNSEGYPGYVNLQHKNKFTNEEYTNLRIHARHIHIQSPLCQGGDIVHGSQHVFSNKEEKESFGKDWQKLPLYRVVITSRNCALPHENPEVYEAGIDGDGLSMSKMKFNERVEGGHIYNNYELVNVLTGRRHVTNEDICHAKGPVECYFPTTQAPENKDDNYQEGGLPSTALSHPPRFVRMPVEKQHLIHHRAIKINGTTTVKGIQKPEDYIALGITRADMAQRAAVIEKFLVNRQLPCIESSKFKDGKMEPLFTTNNAPVCPLQVLQEYEIGLRKTSRSKDYLDPDNPTILTLEHLYKSIPYMVDLVYHFFFRLREWQMSGTRDVHTLNELEKEYLDLMEIVTHSGGGSCCKAGTYPPSNTSSHEDSLFSTTRPQSAFEGATSAKTKSRNIAQAFITLHELGAPFALLFNRETFLSSNCKREKIREKLDDNAPGRNKKLNDKIHEANLFINRIIDELKTKKNKAEVKGYLSLGYWKIKSVTISSPKTMSSVIASFDTIPGYLRRTKGFTSFRTEQPFQISIVPAFTLETNMKLMSDGLRDRNQDDTPPTPYVVRYINAHSLPVLLKVNEVHYHAFKSIDDDEKIPIQEICKESDTVVLSLRDTAESNHITAHGEMSTTTSSGSSTTEMARYPKEWITSRQMVSYTCSLDMAKFDEVMDVYDGPGLGKKRKKSDIAFNIPSLGGILSLLMTVMVAAAARANPLRSVHQGKRGKYVLPLCFPHAEDIPGPHRLEGMPLPNSDMDVANCLFFANAMKYKKILDEENKGPTGIAIAHSGAAITEGPLDEKTRDYIKNLLLMATILRMTGDVPHLRMFGEYTRKFGNSNQKRYAALDLPTLATIDLFKSFLRSFPDAKFGSFVSRQHKGSVPEEFLDSENGLDEFEKFIEDFSGTAENCGMQVLDGILRSRHYRTRALMRDVLGKELAESAGIVPGKKIAWLAHKIMADVEMQLHGIFGPVTFESLGFGFGCEIGFTYVTRDSDGSSEREKFEEKHEQMTEELKGLDPTHLKVLGFMIDDEGCIVSILTGREFSLTDTEHIMCKIYMCAQLVHPSHTLSRFKDRARSHCWPLVDEYDALGEALALFEDIWSYYCSDDAKELKLFMKDNYPPHFDYHESYWVSEDTALFEDLLENNDQNYTSGDDRDERSDDEGTVEAGDGVGAILDEFGEVDGDYRRVQLAGSRKRKGTQRRKKRSTTKTGKKKKKVPYGVDLDYDPEEEE